MKYFTILSIEGVEGGAHRRNLKQLEGEEYSSTHGSGPESGKVDIDMSGKGAKMAKLSNEEAEKARAGFQSGKKRRNLAGAASTIQYPPHQEFVYMGTRVRAEPSSPKQMIIAVTFEVSATVVTKTDNEVEDPNHQALLDKA
jgi:hypothetical protein